MNYFELYYYLIEINLKILILLKYNQLKSICVMFKNSKTIKFLEMGFRIFNNGDCCSYYGNVEDFLNSYKLLINHIKND